MAASPAPNRPPHVLAFPPTSSTALEVATLRLATGEPFKVAMPRLRPWFSPGERQAAKVRRRVLRRAARRRLENRTR